MRRKGSPENLFTRFMRFVLKTDGCWEWIGCKVSSGYGRIWTGEKNKWKKSWSHRVSWEMFRGPIPKGLCVCHSCDNPSCVNPEHLWLGTKTDNHRDMVRKGREKFNMNIGKVGIETRFKSGRKPLKI